MNVTIALQLLIAGLQEAQALGNAIAKAQAEGRQDLTDEEVASFAGTAHDSAARLQAKIDALPSG